MVFKWTSLRLVQLKLLFSKQKLESEKKDKEIQLLQKDKRIQNLALSQKELEEKEDPTGEKREKRRAGFDFDIFWPSIYLLSMNRVDPVPPKRGAPALF